MIIARTSTKVLIANTHANILWKPGRSWTNITPTCLASSSTPTKNLIMTYARPKAASVSTTFAECATLRLRN